MTAWTAHLEGRGIDPNVVARHCRIDRGVALVPGFSPSGMPQSGQRWDIAAEARGKRGTRRYLPGEPAPTWLMRSPRAAERPLLVVEGVTDAASALSGPHRAHAAALADSGKYTPGCGALGAAAVPFVAILDFDGDDRTSRRMATVARAGGLPVVPPTGIGDYSDWAASDPDFLDRVVSDAVAYLSTGELNPTAELLRELALEAVRDQAPKPERHPLELKHSGWPQPTDRHDRKALDDALSDPAQLQGALEAAGSVRHNGRWTCPDPGHDPQRQLRDPTLSIDGGLWCCHGGKHTGPVGGSAWHMLTHYLGLDSADAAERLLA